MSAPVPRTVPIELDGVLQSVHAHYHRDGHLVGRMVTDAVFRGISPTGEPCPGPVRMALHRPLAGTDTRLVVVDSAGVPWVMAFGTWHQTTPYRIIGFYTSG
ncbi:hypothetical protein EDD96_6832 [Streptomyces sp. Ag109_G2-6]|nr:hypothetical protein EDD96_6832 [Streptomyces sp. Ag109_G2-6]